MIWALRNWQLALAGTLALGLIVAAGVAYVAIGNAREAELRATSAEGRLQMIEEERNRRDEVQTLDADDLHERLREWVLR